MKDIDLAMITFYGMQLEIVHVGGSILRALKKKVCSSFVVRS